ncbi:MAG: response regulator [Gammaproteobacteria bacterium]
MSTPKILIVDDSDTRAARLEAIVRDAGFTPVHAGSDALERARAERPDLILLNVVIPEADGYEVCRELRQDRAVRHIPVIAVATPRSQADQLWARMQGASDVVSAPYSIEQLIGAIRTALI